MHIGMLWYVLSQGDMIAVGMLLTEHPPHRSRRAQFTHRAPTLGSNGKAKTLPTVLVQVPGAHFPGPVSGVCGSLPSSPWSPPLAPPAPHSVSLVCSSASQLSGRRRRRKSASLRPPPKPSVQFSRTGLSQRCPFSVVTTKVLMR